MSDNEQKAGELPAAAIAALTKGRQIEAVKIVRSEWNLGLKEAKECVDQYLSSEKISQGVRNTPTVERGKSRLLPFVVIMIVVIIGYYMWSQA